MRDFTRNENLLHVKRTLRYGCRMDSSTDADERVEPMLSTTSASTDYVRANELGKLLAQRRKERGLRDYLR